MANDPLWIEHMHMKKGALRRRTHTPKGKRIPKKTIEKDAKKGGSLGGEARLAETLEHLPHPNRFQGPKRKSK